MSGEERERGDAAVEGLLERAEAPARIDPAARERILSALREAGQGGVGQGGSGQGGAANEGGSKVLSLDAGRKGQARRWSPVGLGLAFAACLGLLWAAPRLLQRTPRAPAEAIAHVAEGARPEVLPLGDGAELWLRSGAAVDTFEGEGRLRLRAGEALLRGAPGAGARVIEAAAGSVKVTGGDLLVGIEGATAEAAGEVLAVAVLRGEAEVTGAGGSLVLRAGEAAVVRPGAPPERREAPRLSHAIAWARPLLADEAGPSAIRAGNLLARDPWWAGEWPLPIRRLGVDVYVEDGVARATFDQSFFNPSLRTLEGVYSFPLPADAAISRLAMYVDGALMEGGVVERQRGRTIYESIVYRRRDPALLEWMAGNVFRMRVFPLPGRTEKRILLSYTEPLHHLYDADDLRVPIPEVDFPVDRVDVRVHVKDGAGWSLESSSHPLKQRVEGGDRIAEWSGTRVTIGDDLLLRLRRQGATPPVVADRSGDLWMVRARPDLSGASTHTRRRWVILVDTSASQGGGELAAEERLVGHLVRALDADDRFTVLAFDSRVRSMGGLERVGDADPEAARAFARAEGRERAGATDLAGALRAARAILDGDARADEAPAILYLGDGQVGALGQTPAELGAALGEGVTFVGVAIGDEVDAAVMDALAGASGGMWTAVDGGEDLAWRAIDLVATLATPRVHGLRVRLLGEGDAPLEGPADASTDRLAAGEEVIVTARSDAAPRAIEITGEGPGGPFRQRLEVPAPREGAGFVPQLWARARAEALGAAGAEAEREAITALGLEHFLVTPFTSLLVVESEAMARDFKLKLPTGPRWAEYGAPTRIPVVVEPVGRPGDPPPGSYVVRTPPTILQSPWAGYQADLWSGLRQEQQERGGLGLRGVGFGGGGVGDGTIGLGDFGLVGKGGGGGFTDLVSASVSEATVPDVAGAAAPILTSEDLAGPIGWKREEPSTATRRTRGPQRLAHLAGETVGFGGGFGGVFGGVFEGSWSMGQGMPWPAGFNYAGDPRLDDLGLFVPGLLQGGLDVALERLRAAAARRPAGSVSAAARERIERARAAAPRGVFVAEDGGTLAIDGAGRMRRSGGPAYLGEVSIYDGEALVTRYEGLGLAIRRPIGDASLALHERWAPWLLPPADHLARFFVVEAAGERSLRLGLPGGAGEVEGVIEVELDEAMRVTSIVERRGKAVTGTTRIAAMEDGSLRIDRGEGATVLRRGGDDAVSKDMFEGGGAAGTELDFPFAALADAEAAVRGAAAGSATWRRAQQQRLASLWALGRGAEAAAVVAELAATGPVRPGELVLASAGVRGLEGGRWKAVAAAAPAGDPTAAYLGAVRGGDRAFAAVARAHGATLPGLMASYRAFLGGLGRGRAPASSAAALAAFLDAGPDPILAYVAAQTLAQRYGWWQPKSAASAWLALAERSPRWRPQALQAAGSAHYSHGDSAAAAGIFVTMLEEATRPGAPPPRVDWITRHAIQGSLGEGRWQLLWGRWRAAVEERGDPRHLLAFVGAALLLGEGGEIHRVLARIEPARVGVEAGVEVVTQLLRAGMVGEARPLLRHLVAAAPGNVEVQLAAALVAEHLGDVEGATRALEAAIAAPGLDRLDDLRACYRRLFELHARTARSLGEAQAAEAGLAAALAVAGRWRAEDADNPAIDVAAASLLFDLGRPDEARRHLFGIVDRHPAEGDAFGQVAEAMVREGALEEADALLQRAAAVEPTNPTWLLRRAQGRLALGDEAGALALVDAIVAGRWQDRFANVSYEAGQLARQLRGPGKGRR